MSKLFGINRPDTNLRKNGFDLSSRTLYTQSPGMLVPVFCRDLNPGEKVRLSLSAFTRTQPLNSSAFVRSKQYFHFFFVPYRQLWSGWQNFINGVDYRTSSLQQKGKYTKVPSFGIFSYIHRYYHKNRNGGKIFDANSDNYRDPFGFRYIDGISRLMDMLGYGFTLSPVSPLGSSSTDYNVSNLTELVDKVLYRDSTWEVLVSNPSEGNWVDNRKFNIFRFLAYQKIYNDFYKRDDYEATDPLSFNIDDIYDGRTLDSMEWTRFISMFQMRYRWLPKDLVSGVVPSELFNSGAALTLGRSFGLDNSVFVKGDNVVIAGTSTGSTGLGSSGNGGDVSVRSIRAAFALEKMYKLTRRAQGHDYISQTMAHYGFQPPKGLGDKVQFMGGYSNDIDITDVVTTAETEQSPAGAIFGKGQGSMQLGDDIDFTADEHGVLMCISSIVPELDYSGEGMDPFNVKFDRGDYFQPEFQDLGLQPIFGQTLENYLEHQTERQTNSALNSAILGYVPRYSEYKTAMDVLHGEFRNQRSLSAWSATTTLSHASTGLRVSSMRIHPSSLDRIFSVKYNGKDATDQFMTSASLQCRIIRPMSITGQTL